MEQEHHIKAKRSINWILPKISIALRPSLNFESYGYNNIIRWSVSVNFASCFSGNKQAKIVFTLVEDGWHISSKTTVKMRWNLDRKIKFKRNANASFIENYLSTWLIRNLCNPFSTQIFKQEIPFIICHFSVVSLWGPWPRLSDLSCRRSISSDIYRERKYEIDTISI